MKGDTIAAPVTPPGTGAVSIVKLSGPNSFPIAEKLTGRSIPHRKAITATLKDPFSGSTIDTALVIGFKGPHSQTGEDIVEFHVHGNPLIVNRVLEVVFRLGARPAQPGEFTRRAFENGKIDLLQAESVAEIVAAQSETWLQHALKALTGQGSQKIKELREALLQAAVMLETYIEFPEEDDASSITTREIQWQLSEACKALEAAIARFKQARKSKSAGTAVIVGPPNAGKSTLFNALLGFERVLTSPVPGTTRDYVDVTLRGKGVHLTIVDTPGIWEGKDKLDVASLEMAKKVFKKSDLYLVVLDGSREIGKEEEDVLSLTEDKPRFIVINKTDLPQKINLSFIEKIPNSGVFKVSALKGQGVDELKEAVERFFSPPPLPEADIAFLREREIALAEEAISALNKAKEHISYGHADLAAEELRDAIEKLSDITGEITTQDILDKIFSTFCIGK